MQVTLPANWTAPQAGALGEGAALQPLRRDEAHGYPEPGTAGAVFTAVRTGAAAVAAHTDFPCLHGHPMCALPQQMFIVTVLVVPPTGQPAGPLPVPPVG